MQIVAAFGSSKQKEKMSWISPASFMSEHLQNTGLSALHIHKTDLESLVALGYLDCYVGLIPRHYAMTDCVTSGLQTPIGSMAEANTRLGSLEGSELPIPVLQ